LKFKYLSELTPNYVIDQKKGDFILKKSKSNNLYSMVQQVFYLNRRLAIISDEAEKNGDFFRTK